MLRLSDNRMACDEDSRVASTLLTTKRRRIERVPEKFRSSADGIQIEYLSDECAQLCHSGQSLAGPLKV